MQDILKAMFRLLGAYRKKEYITPQVLQDVLFYLRKFPQDDGCKRETCFVHSK